MKIAITLTLIGTTLTNAAYAADFSPDQVKAECEQKWDGQYDMIAYCIEKREDGLSQYTTLRNAVDGNPELTAAMDHCTRKWQQQWDMVGYCAQKQLDGVRATLDTLNTLPQRVQAEVFHGCASKWEPQHDMIAYCVEKQAQAWRKLNQ